MLNDFIDSFFNSEVIFTALPSILSYGLWNTLVLALTSTAIGVVIGLVLAVFGVSRSWILRAIARVYTDVLRGLPAILTILLVGLSLAAPLRGITGGNPYFLAILALSLIAGAYIGEIFRGGILAIDKGQMEASRALGMSYGASMRLVVVPQAARQVLPSLVNQFISIVKDTSLVYILGLITTQRDLFRVGQDTAVQTGNLSPLVLAGLFYLVITVPLTHLVNFIDNRLRNGKPAKKVLDPEQDLKTAVVDITGEERAR
ncbi:MAG: amino acid ABC transporter permease [Leucobacter sp.]